MSQAPQLEPRDVAHWRSWLAEHHATERVVWLVFRKAHTGSRTFTYEEAVEEALCFGWIDSIVKRLDDDRYAQKFTPRTATGKWSPSNRARLRRLLAAGRMTEAGLARVSAEVLASLDSPDRAAPPQAPELTPELDTVLRGDARALAGFERLSPSQRRLHVGWVMSAKRDETRSRRLAEVMELLAQGKTISNK